MAPSKAVASNRRWRESRHFDFTGYAGQSSLATKKWDGILEVPYSHNDRRWSDINFDVIQKAILS
jgi:hypothetical protein